MFSINNRTFHQILHIITIKAYYEISFIKYTSHTLEDFFNFVEDALFLPKDTFIMARLEFAVPTEAKVFLGYFTKIIIVRNHCHLAYVLVTKLRL